MKSRLVLLFILVSTGTLAQSHFIEYVDPMIGNTDSRWMQFPGPTTPFGMVKLSPDNQGDTWRGGYDYRIEEVIGFSHIHSWTMGGLLNTATTGSLQVVPGKEGETHSGYRSKIDHSKETASLGYYSVELEDYGIKVELTSTTRTGFQRYTFPASSDARILFDLKTGSEYPYEVRWASIKKINDYEIEGFSTQASFDKPTNLLNDYTIYFVAKTDKPMKSFGTWENEEIDSTSKMVWGKGDVGAFLEFETSEGEVIQLKTAISFVSIEQARKNMRVESDPYDWNFEAVRKKNVEEWKKILSKVAVKGGTEENKKKFYTNFYRSYSGRTIFSDVDGQYVDMNEQKRKLPEDTPAMYGGDAFWNTFWNLNQLWNLVTPEVSNNWVRSLLEYYRVGGWLPNGPPGVEYCDIMGAQHEVALINSAYQMGIRNYDVELAYEAIKKTIDTPGQAHPSGGLVGNRNFEVYEQLGYVPYGADSHYNVFGKTYEGPTSNTLEYAFDDWNAAQFAKSLGREADFNKFIKRAFNYRNVFDPQTKYMRPRYRDGTWMKDFEPVIKDRQSTSWSWLGSGFVEGNSWQYTWMVPHDIGGLLELLGKEVFNSRLLEGFEISSEYNFSPPGDKFSAAYINHGNQPNMHAAYLFNYSGKPWLTQFWVREIMDQYYGASAEHGWLGDEDQGQAGAWFVMSAIGLFQMNGGGSATPIYELGSPLFEEVTIHLDPKYFSGGTFTIRAEGVSDENRYIQSVHLNGKKLQRIWLKKEELTNGGELVLKMGKEPNKSLGTKKENFPPSLSHPF